MDRDTTGLVTKEQVFFLGPFSLGDFHAKSRDDGEILKSVGDDLAPAWEKMIDAYKRCQFFITDRTVMRPNGTWAFDSPAKPQVLVGGELRFVVPNALGKEFEFQITKPDTRDSHTEVHDESSKSWRRLRLVMECYVRVKGGAEGKWNLFADFPVFYDVYGKQIEEPRPR